MCGTGAVRSLTIGFPSRTVSPYVYDVCMCVCVYYTVCVQVNMSKTRTLKLGFLSSYVAWAHASMYVLMYNICKGVGGRTFGKQKWKPDFRVPLGRRTKYYRFSQWLYEKKNSPVPLFDITMVLNTKNVKLNFKTFNRNILSWILKAKWSRYQKSEKNSWNKCFKVENASKADLFGFMRTFTYLFCVYSSSSIMQETVNFTTYLFCFSDIIVNL